MSSLKRNSTKSTKAYSMQRVRSCQAQSSIDNALSTKETSVRMVLKFISRALILFKGYITTPAKHGFRVLTGKRLEELPIPPMIFVQLRVLAVAIDTYSKKVSTKSQYDIC